MNQQNLFGVILCCVVSSTLAAVTVPYKEFDPYPFTANTTTCPPPVPNQCLSSLLSHLSSSNLHSRLITDPSSLYAYAEDYGHIFHALPLAVFVPNNELEVSIFIAVANILSLNPETKFQIVVRGGSGNVQGATQASCTVRQILLDNTKLDSVVIEGTSAWVGPGAPWLSFVQEAAAHNLRPTVIPDYLGITLGGFISVGGFGGDTPAVGPAVDQVLELRVVTAGGQIVTALPGSKYFEAVRGGMGVFGVITNIKLRLVPSYTYTQTVHILTPYYSAYVQTMHNIMAHYIPSRVHTIQSFAVPNTEDMLEIFVAPKADLDRVRPNVNFVLAQNKSWVYYIELAVRTNNLATTPTQSEIATWLAAPMDPALMFFTNYSTPDWDNRLKLFTVPALVATGAWYAEKPWTIVAFPESNADVFDAFLQPLDPFLDVGFGLIAFYPCNTSLFNTNSFLSVPRTSSVFFLATLGRNELTGSPANLQNQENGNRKFWNTFKSLGQSSVYASSIIPGFGPSDWAHSYGNNWQHFLSTKKELDPHFLFGDQRNFGFASLY